MITTRCLSRRRAMRIGAAAAALPLFRIGTAGAGTNRVLRFTLDRDISVLDPYWTADATTRLNAFAVFDTLFGMDSNHKVSAQMVDGVLIEDDGRRWTLVLRDGMTFHDGERVLARDCVASIRRWAPHNSFGQALLSATDELSAADDRRIVFRLKRPFPLLPDALGTPTEAVPAIMPERLANSGDTLITEMVGSGPFRFKADERVPGSHTVYERFAAYKPRESGTPDWLAGPKIAHFDRIEWTVIPDASTRAAALQNGEVDWWGVIAPDLVPLLRDDRHVRLAVLDSLGHMLTMEMNHLQPPFSNRAIRQAMLRAVDQKDFVMAVAGSEPELCRTGVGLFPLGSPMASDAGLDVFRHKPDMQRVRQDIVDAGYRGERVALISVAGDFAWRTSAQVGADMLKKAGMNVDYQLKDMATVIQQLHSKAPVDEGGWSCCFPDWVGTSVRDPAASPLVRGVGAAAPRAPWASSPRLEELRDAWFSAPDLVTRQRIAAEIQVEALNVVTAIPLGMFYDRTAYRAELTGVLQGFPNVFWNVRRRT